MERFKSLRGGHRPLLGGQGRYLADNWRKMLNHDRYKNDKHTHARLYPWGIQRMAHKDGGVVIPERYRAPKYGVSSSVARAGVASGLRLNKLAG